MPFDLIGATLFHITHIIGRSAMKKSEKLLGTEVPRLRVVGGEENDSDDVRTPPDLSGKERRDWEMNEAFWAGRNCARRISARLVA